MNHTVPFAARFAVAGVALLALVGRAAANVVLIEATDSYVFTDEDDDGAFETISGGLLRTVSVRNFDDLPGQPVDVAFLGFDTSGFLASEAVIQRVRFEYRVVSFTDTTTGVDVGTFDYPNFLPADPNVSTVSQGSIAPVALGPGSLDLDAQAIAQIGGTNLFGIRLSGGTEANVQFAGDNSNIQRPFLRIDYTSVPEPATAGLALLAGSGLLLRRRPVA